MDARKDGVTVRFQDPAALPHIEAAAARLGLPRSAFIRQSAIVAARRVLGAEPNDQASTDELGLEPVSAILTRLRHQMPALDEALRRREGREAA